MCFPILLVTRHGCQNVCSGQVTGKVMSEKEPPLSASFRVGLVNTAAMSLPKC